MLILFCSMKAFADESAPTVSDAHQFIGELVGVNLVHWKEHSVSQYKGNACTSSFRYGASGTSIDVDWSLITEVTNGGGISGRLSRTFSSGESFTDTHFSMQTDDDVAQKRLVKAMTLLMHSCAKKSKFD